MPLNLAPHSRSARRWLFDRNRLLNQRKRALELGGFFPARISGTQAAYINEVWIRRSRIVANNNGRVGLGCPATPWKKNPGGEVRAS